MLFEEQLTRLRSRYQASPVPGFLSWWGEELLSLLPTTWRQRLWPPRARLLLSIEGQQLHLWRAMGQQVDPQERMTLDLTRDSDFVREQVRQVLASHEDAPQTVLCISSSHVLTRRVTMPAAAESSLAGALAYEMDRHTPFTKDEVYFDFRIAGRERDENLLSIDLFVTPREALEAQVNLAEQAGFGLDAADLNHADIESPPELSGINLLAEEHRIRHGSRRVRFNWAMAGVAVLLLAVAMAESLYLQEQAIAQLEEEIEASQLEQRIVRNLRSELEEAMAAATFLSERKREAPSILVVLGQVTELLPNDTWVQRMQITGTELQLQGLSDGAQRLIELLNSASKLEGAYFKGATTTDQRLNKERFTVAANIVMSAESQQENDDATAAGP
ncbi:MAG: PilN domain-containing protein [Wenzhouxiangellaceae bacterium]